MCQQCAETRGTQTPRILDWPVETARGPGEVPRESTGETHRMARGSVIISAFIVNITYSILKQLIHVFPQRSPSGKRAN